MTRARHWPSSRPVALWAALIAMTLISSESLVAGRWIADPRIIATIVIALTFVKVRIVLLDFMEVRYAPDFMRAMLEVWVAVMAAVLAGAYWIV